VKEEKEVAKKKENEKGGRKWSSIKEWERERRTYGYDMLKGVDISLLSNDNLLNNRQPRPPHPT